MNFSLKTFFLLLICLLQAQLLNACPRGRYGDNCDIWPTRLIVGYEQDAQIYGNWMYFSFQVSGFDLRQRFDEGTSNYDDLMLYISKPEDVSAAISITFQDSQDDSLPTSESLQDLDTSEETSEIRIKASTFQENNGKVMMIGIYSEDIEDISIATEYTEAETTSSPSLIYLIFIPIGILVVALFVLGLYCYRRKLRLQEENVPIRQQQRAPRPLQPKPEDIKDLLAKSQFSTLSSKFDQKTCCICLDKYDPAAVCVQLYCQHIFHSQCIESWLQKNTTCPDCRKPMTAEAIKKHEEEMKKKDEGNCEEYQDEKNGKEEFSNELRLEVEQGLIVQPVEINFLKEKKSEF